MRLASSSNVVRRQERVSHPPRSLQTVASSFAYKESLRESAVVTFISASRSLPSDDPQPPPTTPSTTTALPYSSSKRRTQTRRVRHKTAFPSEAPGGCPVRADSRNPSSSLLRPSASPPMDGILERSFREALVGCAPSTNELDHLMPSFFFEAAISS